MIRRTGCGREHSSGAAGGIVVVAGSLSDYVWCCRSSTGRSPRQVTVAVVEKTTRQFVSLAPTTLCRRQTGTVLPERAHHGSRDYALHLRTRSPPSAGVHAPVFCASHSLASLAATIYTPSRCSPSREALGFNASMPLVCASSTPGNSAALLPPPLSSGPRKRDLCISTASPPTNLPEGSAHAFTGCTPRAVFVDAVSFAASELFPCACLRGSVVSGLQLGRAHGPRVAPFLLDRRIQYAGGTYFSPCVPVTPARLRHVAKLASSVRRVAPVATHVITAL